MVRCACSNYIEGFKEGVGSTDEKFTNIQPVASMHFCLLRLLLVERLATLPLCGLDSLCD